MSERFKRKILHVFFPARCPICGEVIGYMDRFCSDCSDKLENIAENEAIKGARSFTVAFPYDDNTRPAIMLLKDGICGNADYSLGNELADCLAAQGIPERIDMIIPVPMYKSDQSLRGFNQAELIAKVIGRRFHIPVSVGTVIKNRKTKQQKSLDRDERMKNLSGAYSVCKPQDIAGKRVLLVDDVSTTGSTLTELTSLLLLAGASEVCCAACCKTVMNNNF